MSVLAIMLARWGMLTHVSCLHAYRHDIPLLWNVANTKVMPHWLIAVVGVNKTVFHRFRDFPEQLFP
jgi:hypothetical protein